MKSAGSSIEKAEIINNEVKEIANEYYSGS
jgi:hypothetical protein